MSEELFPSLFHVTGSKRIDKIANEGLTLGNPLLCNDVYCDLSEEEDNSGYAESDDAYVSEDSESKLNEILNDFMPKKFKDAGVNREAIYFWTSEHQAAFAKHNMQKSHTKPLCLVEINPEKIPCKNKCVIADSTITDDMFELLGESGTAYDYDFEESEESKKLDKMAKKFWKTAKFYSKKAHEEASSTDEVFCPCSVPPEAIRNVQGCAIEKVGGQYTLKKFGFET